MLLDGWFFGSLSFSPHEKVIEKHREMLGREGGDMMVFADEDHHKNQLFISVLSFILEWRIVCIKLQRKPKGVNHHER